MQHFKKVKEILLTLLLAVLMLSVTSINSDATTKKFDFESGMSGSITAGDPPGANRTVTQNLTGHTLVVTQDQGNILYMIASDYNGDNRSSLSGTAVIMDATYGTSTKLTLTVSGGYTFDLNALNAMNQNGGNIDLKFTTTKGSVVKTLPDNGGNGSSLDLSAGAALKGVSSVEITLNGGGPLLLELDDVVLDNITPPLTPLTQVTGATLSSSGVASWNNVSNESSYDVQLYKGGVAVGSAVNVAADTLNYNFLSTMRSTGAGTYVIAVTAKGDGITFSDGTQSAPSATQTVAALSTVSAGLTWSGNVAHWTTVANAASYDVQLYKSSTPVGTPVNVLSGNAATGADFSSDLTSNGVGIYTYKVTAKADPTTLYLDAPQSTASASKTVSAQLNQVSNVALSASGLASWDNVSNESSYDVQLYKGGVAEGSVINVAADVLSHDYLSAMRSAGAGDYTVKVVARGNGSTYLDSALSAASETRSIVQLADVNAGLAWSGNVAHWTTVASATNYDVQLYKDGNPVGSATNVIAANVATGVDFSALIASNGGGTYTYKVTAKGDGILLLNASASVASGGNLIATPLSQVTGVALSAAGVASWSNVSNESSYDVQLYKGGVAVGSAVNVAADTLNYNFLSTMRSTGVGTYTVKVTAKGDGATYSDGPQSAASGSQSVAILPSVSAGLTWTGQVAHWTTLANAASYDVQLYKDGSPLGSSENVLQANAATGVDYSSAITTGGAGIYTYKVTAKANTATLYLDASQSVSSNNNTHAVQLAQVANVALSTLGVASWDNIANESSFDVQLFKDNVPEGSSVNVPSNTLNHDFLSAMRSGGIGDYTVKVTAKGNGSIYLDSPVSASSNIRTIIKLTHVSAGLTWSGNVAHWTAVPNASSYDVQLYKNGNLVGTPSHVLSADAASGVDFWPTIQSNGIGNYTYKVTAIGDQTLQLDANTSASSSVLSVTTVDTTLPTVGSGGIISASDLTRNSVKLAWSTGTDNETTTSNLEYKLVKSTANNLNSVTASELNGTTLQDWTKNITTGQAIGLSPSTPYYFNVLVRDEAGNKNCYTSLLQTTLPDSSGVTQHDVTFVVDGGSFVPTQTIVHGAKAVKPTNPTKSSYAFGNWYQDNTLSNLFDFDTPITTSTALYAKWIPEDNSNPLCSVTYFGNGNTAGTVPIDSTLYTTGSAITIAANSGNLVKTNFNFSGWNTTADGSGINFAPESTFNITTSTALYAKWIPVSNNNGGSGDRNNSGSGSSSASTSNSGIDVIVNGTAQRAGTESTTTANGKVTVKLDVDEAVLSQKIDDVLKSLTGQQPSGLPNLVEVPVAQKNVDRLSVALTGDVIKKLENNNFTLSVNEGPVRYNVPATEFNIDTVAKQLGVPASELKKIEIEIQINKVSDALSTQYEAAVLSNNSRMLVRPVEFEIFAKSTIGNGETVAHSVNKFSAYVERVIELPSDVDPGRITTGIVFHVDNTYSHVPTVIYNNGGKAYAKLNSLTNSAYSVLYNPITVASVQNHWSKKSVNDMASRMVIEKPEHFRPDQAITRAEFAEYITKALGLYRTGEPFVQKFKDVKSNTPYAAAINKATEYQLISGYGDGNFRPTGLITREEAMVMYSKAMKIVNLSSSNKNLIGKYSDAKSISPWAKQNVTDVVGASVFGGKTNTTLAPKAQLTCAEAATAIRNLLVATQLINQ